MKKNGEKRYRMGLTDCELWGKSNARNAVRRKRKGEGKETSCLCELLLRYLTFWKRKKDTVNFKPTLPPRYVE